MSKPKQPFSTVFLLGFVFLVVLLLAIRVKPIFQSKPSARPPTPILQIYSYPDIDTLLTQIKNISRLDYGPQTTIPKWQELKPEYSGNSPTEPAYISGQAIEAVLDSGKSFDYRSYLIDQGFINTSDSKLPVLPAVLGLSTWYLKGNIICEAADGYAKFDGRKTDQNSEGTDKIYSGITCGLFR